MNKNAAYLMVLCTGLFAGMQNTQAQVPPPAAYPPGTQVSFVRTWDAAAPEQNSDVLTTRPLKDVKQATQYFDGLGRPVQSIIKEGSLETATNTKGDVVSPVVYDDLGREQYKYMAFSSADITGQFKTNPFQQQAVFMTAQYWTQAENIFYSKTNFETSPLSRVEKAMARQ